MANPLDECVDQRQARFNRSTRAHWQHFAPHRTRVQELILTGRELVPGGKFIALGAGNCNDLELRRLLDAFDEVHLVDIDREALSAACERQGVNGAAGLRLHAPVDLTGIAPIVSTWKRTDTPRLPDVRHAIDASDKALTPDLTGPFDVVLSSCVLSQIVGYATDTLGGDRHPGFADLVRAIRTRHLRLMVDLLKPGGTGLLLCDLVSSDSLDVLPRVPEHELPGLIQKIAREGNFFSGLFPDALLAALQNKATVATRLRDVRLLPPWLWRLGPRRSFLVYAVRFRRAQEEESLVRGIDGSADL
jgi:hypothetical protein